MSDKIKRSFAILGLLFFIVFAGCKEDDRITPTDTPTSGTIYISVDESFRPVMEEQIAQYERLNPGTRVDAAYKSEAACLRDLFFDSSNRMVIISRPLTRKEERYLMDTLKYIPGNAKIASDAVAIVLNAASNDTLFTLERLQQQLQGKINRKQTIVFDGLSATGTVRFITDSILKGAAFDTSVVKAAKNSEGVLDYVASNPNAIGFVGIEWIGNPENEAQIKMLQKVKLGYVQCDPCDDKPFVKPMQESISTRRYPLVRGLYYVLKENFTGLGTGFASFLKYEQGQLIFRRSYLNPIMDFDVRRVRVTEN